MTENILEIKDLTVSFDGFKALNNLTFSMRPGELRVIIGPNGAGKTTFLDVITGKVKPTIGKVVFKGKTISGLSEHTVSRMGIGRKFQTPRVYLNLTVRENLDLACNQNKNVFSTLFSKAKSTEKNQTVSLLETIGLTEKADIQASWLAHGEKQRLEIGMLVAQSPDLLLVDEPVAGLTDEETENVGNLLLALAESHSLIVIEHDMEFVRQIARQVTVLHQGSVLCEGSMNEVQNDPRVIEVYLGEAPTVTPEQMNLIRLAASMAWADGSFAPEQKAVILTRLSEQFTNDSQHQEQLKEELANYLGSNVPLDQLTAGLTTPEEKEMALRLSYEVIRSNGVNELENIVYQQLLDLLALPAETVQAIAAEIDAQYSQSHQD
ncbi:MAG: urea ABC transporter ATP-binding protein UrtD [Limnothrix sp. RL_2_0]|nr:urea ABC transporter ATP-binding protein UrtD [Limnothrix sp. RL_2_0]